ncbi:MAG TPA: protein kinase, partial [Kofleriaceae bacterium]
MSEGQGSHPVDAAVALYVTNLLAFEGIGRGFEVIRQYIAKHGRECVTSAFVESPPAVVVRIARRSTNAQRYTDAATRDALREDRSSPAAPVPVYPDAEVEALSKRLEEARLRRDKLRAAEIATELVDREILELRRQLREGGQLRAGDALGDGRYLLVKVVGRGGFAVVWEAYDYTARERVAIKVLHSNLAGDPLRRERFFRGAQAMMRLTHPAVVRVLEPKAEEGGFYYFVMEFLPGGNLREAVLEQRLKKDDLLPSILQVAEALAMAHAAGMVHRDVKPTNVVLDEHGRAKLTDFDLVGAHDTTGGTRTGALGTFVYAAPECLERPQDATPRADVYGLGMTAIFCLAGRDLSMDTFRNAERTIAKLECPRPVRQVLGRAVKWKPDDRFTNAATMLDALHDALDPATQVASIDDGMAGQIWSSSLSVTQSVEESGIDVGTVGLEISDRSPWASTVALEDRPGRLFISHRTEDDAIVHALQQAMGRLFISHSTEDDAIVRALQQAMGDLGLNAWIDSRQLRGGDPLWPDIQKAIESAEAYAVVVSPSGLQSSWVGKELRYALDVQKQRGMDAYPVIPLTLDDTPLGALGVIFDHEPIRIPLRSAPGGVEAALDAILVALRKREPADIALRPQPLAEPLEELVLELTDLKLEQVKEGARRATARARLVYEPATPGQRAVTSTQAWRFVAPLGPLEADDLRWYLEKYAIWPGDVFRPRANKVEESLVAWGRLLHDAAMPTGPTASVLRAWGRADSRAGRRFSVLVDSTLEVGVPEVDAAAVREAATLLLGLPWELLHDGDSFLFQGARPTRVRRRLPNMRDFDIAVVAPPIRILLVCARPEDAACSYIDHRVSALPLVDAMEQLPGLVQLHILSPPTLPALREELDRARRARQLYHVLHFDG